MFGKGPIGPSFLSFLSCFRANQIGFEQAADNLNFKHLPALRTKVQSVKDYFLRYIKCSANFDTDYED